MRLNICGLWALVNFWFHLKYARVSKLLQALIQLKMIKTHTPVLERTVTQHYGVYQDITTVDSSDYLLTQVYTTIPII